MKTDNIYYIKDEDAKNISIQIYYKIKKQSKEDLYYYKILNELLKNSSSKLNKKEFLLFKLNQYDVYFSRNIIDSQDDVIITFDLWCVNPKYITDLDLSYVLLVFKDYISNLNYDIDELKQVLNMQKLVLDNIKQDVRGYTNILNDDALFKHHDNYLTLHDKNNVIDNFDVNKLNNIISNFKLTNPSIIYTGDGDEVYDLAKEDNSYKVSKYKSNKCDDLIIKKELDQAVIMMNYKLEYLDNRIAKNMFCFMLGSGSESILFDKIREELNLCYYVYAKQTQEDIVSIVIGTSPDSIKKAVDEIAKLVDNLQEYLTQELMDVVVNKTISRIKKYKTDVHKMATLAEGNILYGYEYDIDKLIELYNNIKLSDVIAVYNETSYLNKLIMGDKQ